MKRKTYFSSQMNVKKECHLKSTSSMLITFLPFLSIFNLNLTYVGVFICFLICDTVNYIFNFLPRLFSLIDLSLSICPLSQTTLEDLTNSYMVLVFVSYWWCYKLGVLKQHKFITSVLKVRSLKIKVLAGLHSCWRLEGSLFLCLLHILEPTVLRPLSPSLRPAV